MLSRLLYTSKANPLLGPYEIRDILRKARRYNSGQGVTGLLSVCKGQFLQALEGERQTLNDLYIRIAADPRHRNCSMLDFKPIEKRLFDRWSMQLIDLDAYNDAGRRKALLQYSSESADEPFSIPADEATALLLDLQDLCKAESAE